MTIWRKYDGVGTALDSDLLDGPNRRYRGPPMSRFVGGKMSIEEKKAILRGILEDLEFVENFEVTRIVSTEYHRDTPDTFSYTYTIRRHPK